MPVPGAITDLSTTAASNSPPGGESVFPLLDDYLRTGFSFIASLRDDLALRAPIASPTFTGTLIAPTVQIAPNFYMVMSGGNPSIAFDSSDYIGYDRTNNAFNFYAGAGQFVVSSADGPTRLNDATTSNGLTRKSQVSAMISAGTAAAAGSVPWSGVTGKPTIIATPDAGGVRVGRINTTVNGSGNVTFSTAFTTLKSLVVTVEGANGSTYVLRYFNASNTGFSYAWDTLGGNSGAGSACIVHYIAFGD